jgi:isochorismate synthase
VNAAGVDTGGFAGVAGWCDADGDGEWVLTNRCAQVHGDSARVFASS